MQTLLRFMVEPFIAESAEVEKLFEVFLIVMFTYTVVSVKPLLALVTYIVEIRLHAVKFNVLVSQIFPCSDTHSFHNRNASDHVNLSGLALQG